MLSLKKRHIHFCIISLIILLFTVFSVYGEDAHTPSDDTHPVSAEEAGGGGHGHSADRKGDFIDLGYRILNFSLLVIVLVIVAKKTKLTQFFSSRSEEIRRRMEDLRKDKEDAEKRYLEIEEQLKSFEEKRNEIVEQYRQEGLSEKDRIISEAKDRVKHIIQQSEMSIEQEIESARNQLKQDIIELATQKAQDILVKEVNESDQEKMVIEFVEKVGKVN